MASAGKGIMLGFFNLLVIAIAIAMTVDDGGHRVPIMVGVVIVGFVPALLAGTLIGMFAGRLDDHPWMRFAILATLATYGVGLIGGVFGGHELVLPSCLPTLAAASVLERWTRKPRPQPQVPQARVA